MSWRQVEGVNLVWDQVETCSIIRRRRGWVGLYFWVNCSFNSWQISILNRSVLERANTFFSICFWLLDLLLKASYLNTRSALWIHWEAAEVNRGAFKFKFSWHGTQQQPQQVRWASERRGRPVKLQMLGSNMAPASCSSAAERRSQDSHCML